MDELLKQSSNLVKKQSSKKEQDYEAPVWKGIDELINLSHMGKKDAQVDIKLDKYQDSPFKQKDEKRFKVVLREATDVCKIAFDGYGKINIFAKNEEQQRRIIIKFSVNK